MRIEIDIPKLKREKNQKTVALAAYFLARSFFKDDSRTINLAFKVFVS